jgi:hypothetical protein
MFDKRTRLIAGVMPLVLGLGAAGMALGADRSGSGDGPIRCEISTASADGMITLKAIVHADVAVSGSYRFRITGAGASGSSNVEQGGNFSIGQGECSDAWQCDARGRLLRRKSDGRHKWQNRQVQRASRRHLTPNL